MILLLTKPPEDFQQAWGQVWLLFGEKSLFDDPFPAAHGVAKGQTQLSE